VRRRALTRASVLLAGALLAGCSYAAPVDRSTVESAAPLADGGVAVAFRQLRYRPATGWAAFPDGGIPRYLDDAVTVGVLSPGGGARILRRWPNPGVHGAFHVTFRASPADPEHLLVLRSWQPIGQGATTAAWSRLAWRDGRIEPYPDFAQALQAEGRRFGASSFGDVRALDATGALLIGAEGDAGDELWIYEAGRGLRRLDGFKHFYDVAGDELYYWRGDEAVLRNWRTGAERLVARYDPGTHVTTRYLLRDPAVQAAETAAPAASVEIADGGAVRVRRPGGEVAEFRPPASWWPSGPGR